MKNYLKLFLRLPILFTLRTYHPYSLLATGNPDSPAESGHLDSRLEFFPSENPSNSSLRSVAQRTRFHVLSGQNNPIKNREFVQRGYIAIVTVLVIGAVMMSVGMAVVLNSINTGQGALSEIKKESGIGYVESCVEDALMRVNKDNTLPATITLPDGTCTVTINSQVGSAWDFTVSGTLEGYTKRIRVTATRENTVTINSWQEI